jgi:CheY-like chemotaxis protein
MQRKPVIIVMTAHGTDGPELAVDVMKKGAVDYVTKPFKSVGRTLDKSIREALAGMGEDVSPALQLATVVQPKNATAEQASQLEVFSGGAMVFFRDRVELCGTTICGGPRCEQARKTLDLLRQKNIKGDFRAFGSRNLAEMIGREGGSLSVPSLIRDIRTRISEELRSIQIQCGRHDVIVRTKQGYQFKDFITVHDADESTGVGIQGHDLPKAGHNVPYHDDPDVPNDPNSDDPNVPDDKAEARGNWVLQELGKGRELRAPDIVQEFGCSLKTAKRDLKSLKDDAVIEFVGSPRTGHYRLKIVTNPR